MTARSLLILLASGEAEFIRQATTKRGIFTALDAVIAVRLGQAILYVHVNGVAMPWTSGELPVK
jgi:hypothetical protein